MRLFRNLVLCSRQIFRRSEKIRDTVLIALLLGATGNTLTASIPEQTTAWGATTAGTGIETKGFGLS